MPPPMPSYVPTGNYITTYAREVRNRPRRDYGHNGDEYDRPAGTRADRGTRTDAPHMVAAVLEYIGKNRMGTAGRSDYRYHRATKIIVMESCRAHTIIAGTSFAMLITALRDDVELPEELPDTIPSAWLDNLDRYRIVLLLSTSKHGPKAIAGTAAEYELKIERRDSARYFVNIPASATEEMEEGEIVLTVELQDTQTDTVMKAERRTVPLVKARL